MRLLCVVSSVERCSRAVRMLGLLISTCCFALVSVAQNVPVKRDSSALTFLGQAVSTAGGRVGLSAIQGFTASGTIKHFWGKSTQQGQLTVKARGMMQFRLDSDLPGGTWSWISNNGGGQVALSGHPPTPIYSHNCINSGWLTLPILKANAALQDQTTTVIDMGLVQFDSGQTRQIRTQQKFDFDPQGFLSKLTRTDFFFDPVTFLLVAIRDVRHPDRDAVNNPLTHIVRFGDYRAVDGLLVPFAAVETIWDQITWQIQLSSIEFNPSLTDSEFQF